LSMRNVDAALGRRRLWTGLRDKQAARRPPWRRPGARCSSSPRQLTSNRRARRGLCRRRARGSLTVP
jgi:hypothetical protein